jgi:diaminopimelate dehydrogenase
MDDGKIKIGIVGYGNLGRGVRSGLAQNPDMELAGIFTRRPVAQMADGGPFFSYAEIEKYKGLVDVMILCGGSAGDLWEQGAQVAGMFNTVDSFDTHAKIPEYFEMMDTASQRGGNLSIISVGWDPGLFSIFRLTSGAVLPAGEEHTFWGPGVSQGHSDAVRKIKGVKLAVQYTLPLEDALDDARSGRGAGLSATERHRRLCYVVEQPGAERGEIERAIKTMPNYFLGYDTEVVFTDEQEFLREHSGMPHGGFCIRTGRSAEGAGQRMEFSLELESNPQFTSCVLIAYARAAARLAGQGQTGARSVFDIAPALISPMDGFELRRRLL